LTGAFWRTAFLVATFVPAFFAALAEAFFTTAAFFAGTFFAAFFAGVDFAGVDFIALAAAQRFRCPSAMRFLAAGLSLRLRFGVCLTATSSAGASFAAFFVGVGFTTSFAALAVAQRFFAASEILSGLRGSVSASQSFRLVQRLSLQVSDC
jgi:hypothetical protein